MLRYRIVYLEIWKNSKVPRLGDALERETQNYIYIHVYITVSGQYLLWHMAIWSIQILHVAKGVALRKSCFKKPPELLCQGPSPLPQARSVVARLQMLTGMLHISWTCHESVLKMLHRSADTTSKMVPWMFLKHGTLVSQKRVSFR